ncbi:MAG TPA: hypothetical protein VIB48_12910 [Acidimicrobiia bacterium]
MAAARAAAEAGVRPGAAIGHCDDDPACTGARTDHHDDGPVGHDDVHDGRTGLGRHLHHDGAAVEGHRAVDRSGVVFVDHDEHDRAAHDHDDVTAGAA